MYFINSGKISVLVDGMVMTKALVSPRPACRPSLAAMMRMYQTLQAEQNKT